jgi:glycosyltransferase involved in cell wall biosynthesis
MEQLPKFTISIPTFNSEKFLPACLESIAAQDYPKELVEVIVSDGGSKDNSVSIAKEYGALVYENKRKLGEEGTKIAARFASGELFVVFAADNGLVGKDWLRRVAMLFIKHKELSCVWGRMIAGPQDPPIMRYYELIQSEPLAHFLNQNLKFYLRKSEKQDPNSLSYNLFSVDPRKPLCWGANGIVYRLAMARDIFLNEHYIGDNELFQYMVEAGHNKVAYSSELNIYHHTIISVWHWVRKWKRNYTEIFLKTRHERRIDWFYFGNFRVKMVFWLFYSLLLVFSGLHAIYLAMRERSVYWLYHPLLCFLQSVTYIFWTLVLPEGRRSLIEQIFKNQLKGGCYCAAKV